MGTGENKVGGVVLCGGESRRMGESKALLQIGGEGMLARVVQIVRSVVWPVVVAHGLGQALPPLDDDVRAVADQLTGVGPLAGLLSGLEALRGECEAVFVCACDQPLLQAAFVSRLIERLGDRQAVAVEQDGYLHSLTAVYRIEVVDKLRRQIEGGDYRVQAFARSCDAVILTENDLRDVDPTLGSLRNINTPEELQNL